MRLKPQFSDFRNENWSPREPESTGEIMAREELGHCLQIPELTHKLHMHGFDPKQHIIDFENGTVG